MKKILVGLLAVILFVAVLFALNWFDRKIARDHLGKAIVCSKRFPFKYPQAEILEYGFHDIRGLACDKNGSRVFVSEASRSVSVDWPDFRSVNRGDAGAAPGLQYPDPPTMCADEPCMLADQRGLAISGGKLYSAEHGRRQITARPLPEAAFGTSGGVEWLGSATTIPGKHDFDFAPSGIAAVDHTLFITNDPERPAPDAPKDVAKTSTIPTAVPEKEPATPAGGVYVCSADQCDPKPIKASLRHPTGVAAEKADGPVFVAERDAHEVRWLVYEMSGGEWRETRSLGSAAVSGETLPEFLGVAFDDSRKMVFAAGPGGLFVFDLTGTLLGRVLFDEPVTGVASGGNTVYLAVGNTLCALTLDPSSTSSNTLSAPIPGPTANLAPSGSQPPKSRATDSKPLSSPKR